MADEFEIANILGSEFIRKISPRLQALSPEIKAQLEYNMEYNIKRIIDGNVSIGELQVKLKGLFKTYTNIVEILESTAKLAEVSLKTQLPLIIPAIFKRIDSGEGGYNSSKFETLRSLILELFQKVRIFEDVCKEQKIDIRQFSLSIPQISRLIDDSPLEGFRETITQGLLKIEQHRVKLLSKVLTRPNNGGLYSFVNARSKGKLQEVLEGSRHFFKKDPSRAHAYSVELFASQDESVQESTLLQVLDAGNAGNCMAILNRGLNPNTLRVNPLSRVCRTTSYSTEILSQLILALCSPAIAETPNLRIPDTTSELVTMSEYSYLDKLFKRIFYRFVNYGEPILVECVINLTEERAKAAITQLLRLPIHEEDSPHLAVLRKIRAKFEESLKNLTRRIADLLSGFQGESALQAMITLELGSPVWVKHDDLWKEMVIAGEETEDKWPVRPITATSGPVTRVPYTDLKFLPLKAPARVKEQINQLNADVKKVERFIEKIQEFTRGVEVDALSSTGTTALLEACRNDRVSLVSTLSEEGADINIPYGLNRVTPLMLAIFNGNVELVQLLCSNPSINIGLRDAGELTALSRALSFPTHAVEENIFNIVQILIAAGADANEVVGRNEETILNIAIAERSLPCIKYLLDTVGLNPNQSSTTGLSPFMCACRRGNMDVINLLIERGVNVNALNERRENALFYAVRGYLYPDRRDANRDTELILLLIKFLIQKGVNPRQENTEGVGIYKFTEEFFREQRMLEYPKVKKILSYLGNVLGCVGGICRAVGIEGFGPNAITRKKGGSAAASLRGRGKRRTKKRRVSRRR